MIYLITYDLRKPRRDYASLYDAIKQLGDNNHPLESVWLVYISEDDASVTDVALYLKKHMDENDLLFVVDITQSPRQGWLPKSSWEWLDFHK